MRVNRLETLWPQTASAAATDEERQSRGETLKSWERKLESLMTEHPKAAVAAATALGLFIGWLVKRK